LERALASVLRQRCANWEYIVVDPGSTDGSRDIIERYRASLTHVVYEGDEGPADGLNKGFACATGDIFCYLNSDDEFEPRAFERVASFFSSNPKTDVVCGHAWIVDRCDKRLRRVWSDPYNRTLVAYGVAIQIQPSTFIRADAFRRVGGFNIRNRISWDSELLCDLNSSGARIDTIDEFLSLYRVHPSSITGAALHKDLAAEQGSIRFERLMGRPWGPWDRYIKGVMVVVRQLRNPQAFFERLFRGKVYGRSP
jgi:glycosyltransferase involved in cell wall biosynthesis